MTRSRPPTAAEFTNLLATRGLSAHAAHLWSFLRYAPGPISDLVLDIPFEYQDHRIATAEATEWFILGVSGKDARTYNDLDRTPPDLIAARKAIHAINNHLMSDPATSRAPSAFEPQPDEQAWMRSNIPSDVVPLYIRAGHTIQSAQTLDARRRRGDTTIEPALRTVAALKRTNR